MFLHTLTIQKELKRLCENNMFYIRLKGGLGNQMFQYAFGESLAKASGLEVKYDTRFLEDVDSSVYNNFRSFAKRPLVLSHFPNIDKNKFVSLPSYKLHSGILGRIYDKLSAFVNPNFIKEKRFQYDTYVNLVGDNKYFDGNWQSYKYFESEEMSARIRQDFFLSRKTTQKTSDQITIAIHIRRGDMANNPRTRSFHGIVTTEYIKQAVEQMYKKIFADQSSKKSVSWIIYSDDINWCREHLHKENIGIEHNNAFQMHEPENTGSDEEKAINQMAHMTTCDHFILSNSTYGWWAAWLSQTNKHKVVICPKEFYKAPGYSAVDLIPPHWIQLNTPLD